MYFGFRLGLGLGLVLVLWVGLGVRVRFWLGPGNRLDPFFPTTFREWLFLRC